MPSKNSVKLVKIYEILLSEFGPMDWWPGETDLEVMIGAILTQNTAWTNVEKAINNLKDKDLMSFEKLEGTDVELIRTLIKPSGYYNQKAKKIKEFVRFVKEEYGFSVDLMKKEPVRAMREKLLNVFGIGEETADSIILYALRRPVFVVDAYTRRILERHGIKAGRECASKAKYKSIQQIFMKSILPVEENVQIYNEYHALIVNAGKNYCRKKPLCGECPLKDI